MLGFFFIEKLYTKRSIRWSGVANGSFFHLLARISLYFALVCYYFFFFDAIFLFLWVNHFGEKNFRQLNKTTSKWVQRAKERKRKKKKMQRKRDRVNMLKLLAKDSSAFQSKYFGLRCSKWMCFGKHAKSCSKWTILLNANNILAPEWTKRMHHVERFYLLEPTKEAHLATCLCQRLRCNRPRNERHKANTTKSVQHTQTFTHSQINKKIENPWCQNT